MPFSEPRNCSEAESVLVQLPFNYRLELTTSFLIFSRDFLAVTSQCRVTAQDDSFHHEVGASESEVQTEGHY